MKKSLIALLTAFLLYSCQSASTAEDTPITSEEDAIQEVIVQAYVEGLQNEGDTLKIDAGFHPQFTLIGQRDDGSLLVLPIDKWRNRQAERAQKGLLPRPDSTRVSAEFAFVDITGDAAVAKLFYFEGEQHTYTDYITLYRIGGEWKIISKTYHTIH